MTAPADLPSTLPGFRDLHRGATIIVCGCGASLNEMKDPERFTTIGVNDVGRLFHPTYLVVLNARQQFSADRFRHVADSRARALFTQLDLGIRHPHIVRFRLGDRGGADPAKYPDRLHYTRNSPYVALQLALHMGASRIGLIGVDFTDHHFFARTGRHSLAGSLSEIDAEYRRVAEAAKRLGTEIVNLGTRSRLTAFPKVCMREWLGDGPPQAAAPRVFFVHYNFLSCGDVFRTGLHGAAAELGLVHGGANWDDPALAQKIARFSPDLLFVVHGRGFVQRWGSQFSRFRSAVWLVDEPYEVDDTERISRFFETVFVNDRSTIERHRNAHYLPVAYDPKVHRPCTAEQCYDTGFIGGGNPSRESYLKALAEAGRLSYVVGGPWSSPAVASRCLARNVPPLRTAELYQRTRIVLNVFRDKHHFNRRGIAAYSLNPRVYEAFACGALVISEYRSEAEAVFPEMPVFRSPQEAVALVTELMEDRTRAEALIRSCRLRLAEHTYAARLRTALHAALGYKAALTEDVPVVSDNADTARAGYVKHVSDKPIRSKYSILMAVCGGLDIVRLSTLKTLRHSNARDARLVVVDNGSSDGAERWLEMLASRGDIDLIRLQENIGHGPALERARSASDSDYIVTLDSDAFPLCDDWLESLRSRLDDRILAAGIGHHRNYVHPSCLMIARRTLDDLGSTFLNEKGGPSRFDVAERLSHDILERGGRLSFLQRNSSQRRGSASEPVFLGSEYESIVYHQWYTTRYLNARGAQVDDVAGEDLKRSLAETIERFDREPRELTVILGIRARPGESERERNARATLESLNHQDLERWRYRIVVVEQDDDARLEKSLGPLADRWIFAPNSGPYNRAWAFNVGACNPEAAAGALCLADADVLFPSDFLRNGLAKIQSGAKAVLPYSEFRYLTAAASIKVLQQPASNRFPLETGNLEGRSFRNSQGGCVFVDAGVFIQMGGFDERFEGWGCEDREFWFRLARHKPIEKLQQTLLHLHHSRPEESGPEAKRNRELLDGIRKSKIPTPATPMGRLDKYRGQSNPKRRDWQNWETWPDAKIERIVRSELQSQNGARSVTAGLLERFGPNVLDVGCGPGAIYARLRARGASIQWTGVDVTSRMLRVARRLFPAAGLIRADAADLPFSDKAFDTVLVRHVLEHLPEHLMIETLHQALRVARRFAIIDFYVKPSEDGLRRTRRLVSDFLETRWTVSDIEEAVSKKGWHVARRLPMSEDAAIWILAPADSADLDIELDEATRSVPKISIVMPTYLRPSVLRRTLQSVLGQTYPHWELILVDNAGDLELAPPDPRIRVFHHTESASASYARNCGIAHATGDLICFFDDDDLMFPSYLQSFVTAFQANPRAAMVRCGMLVTGNRINYSYATPECCMRRQFASPTWDARGPCQDQRYFSRIVHRHGWSEASGDIITIRQPLCRAIPAPNGGLRCGGY